MSLNKQMILFIATLLFIVLIGTFGLNLSNTKNFLQEQLSSHAQDTATSLGLSLSSIEDPTDLTSMETMINAVFDRGYYASIRLTDIENHSLYLKSNTQAMDAVPAWFIKQIKLTSPPAEAVVQSGWIPIGTLTVVSHTGYAYAELWQSMINLLIWFGIAAITAIIIIIYTLRFMLKPLKQMEAQAQAIVKKEYLFQDNLPSTIEFRQVVTAMNAMVTKLKTVFERDANTAEKLQKMAFQDSVTELSNRRHFEMNIDTLLDPNEDATSGTICLIRIQALKELNDQYGYLMGDKLMKCLADSMQAQFSYQNSLFARLNGTELVAVLPGINAIDVKPRVEAMAQCITLILKNLAAEDVPTSLSLAYMHYQPGQSRGNILANLDFAIDQANAQGKNQVFFYNNGEAEQVDNRAWEHTLQQAIEEKRFVLFQQSAYDQDRSVHDQEMFVRLKDIDGTIRSAAYFMPAVEKLNKTAEIDKLVINLAIQHLKTQITGPVLAINLSKSILENDALQAWLMKSLNALDNQAKHLAFEMTERLVSEEKNTSWPLINELKRRQVKFGIDHFGSRLTNMRYLQNLRPDYVKLDGSFSKAIESDENTCSYVSSLCELAKSLDIKVIAMAVENEAQQKAFTELGVDYFQGYLYGAPSPLSH
ncbi:MAG: EAL domain-containing protein [Thiomicrorhabdus sp.]|jgi:diguanylate cyclase (GGDEF)-like protein|nr:EAL domain-containing protein [Thiomicrorhabdus sp.]